MPKIEPVRCVCGAEATVIGYSRMVSVTCKSTPGHCWNGPWLPRRGEAIRQWNRVMTAAKEADNG